MDLILASASPRRSELLRQIGARFTVECSHVAEVVDPELRAEEAVQQLAWQKASAVAVGCQQGVVLGADTVVVQGEKILGKPQSAEEAAAMLQSLSGQWHEVMTGVALVDASGEKPDWIAVEKTGVKFRALSNLDIAAYLATGESMDKAGAYGIQGYGALLVEEIRGCYFNVVGLPLFRVAEGLCTMGVRLYDYDGCKLQNQGLSGTGSA